jgi:hypothetical protein
VSPEALVLKDIPIASEVATEKSAVSAVDVLKAQQAVAKSFISLVC